MEVKQKDMQILETGGLLFYSELFDVFYGDSRAEEASVRVHEKHDYTGDGRVAIRVFYPRILFLE